MLHGMVEKPSKHVGPVDLRPNARRVDVRHERIERVLLLGGDPQVDLYGLVGLAVAHRFHRSPKGNRAEAGVNASSSAIGNKSS